MHYCQNKKAKYNWIQNRLASIKHGVMNGWQKWNYDGGLGNTFTKAGLEICKYMYNERSIYIKKIEFQWKNESIIYKKFKPLWKYQYISEVRPVGAAIRRQRMSTVDFINSYLYVRWVVACNESYNEIVASASVGKTIRWFGNPSHNKSLSLINTLHLEHFTQPAKRGNNNTT